MVDVDGYDGEASRLFVATNCSCDTHLMVTLLQAMILMMMMLMIMMMMMMMMEILRMMEILM